MKRCTKGVDADPDDANHHENENGYGGPFARQDAVDAPTALVFLAFFGLDYGLVAKFLDEGKTHLSHGCGAVESTFFFHLHNEVLQGFFLVLRELQGIKNNGVAFHKFGGGKSHGYVGALGMVLDEVHDAVQAAVDGTTMVVLVAEVLAHRGFLELCDMDGMVDQLVDTFVFRGGNGHHG